MYSFDGKKCKVRLPNCQSIKKEVITVTYEPGGGYLHHFTPEVCSIRIKFP